MPKYLVVSTSGNSDSNSRRMAQVALEYLKRSKADCEWLDLRAMKLPFCDGDQCYSDPAVQKLNEMIEGADAIMVATPIYNYDVSATAKNMVELTGSSWEDKIVGFLCAAGGSGSYMSVMAFANSLMLDFRCVIIPRFVYATGDCFEGDDLKDKAIAKRIDELVAELIRFGQALGG